MAVKIKKLYRNLAVRLCVLICILVVPVNILTVTLTRVVGHQYEAEILERYQSELNLFCIQMDKELESIEKELIRQGFKDFRGVLGADDGKDHSWQRNLFFEKLVDLRKDFEIVDMAYLTGHSVSALLTGDNTEYSTTERMLVKKEVMSYDFGEKYGYAYHVAEFHGHPFLILNVNYGSSSYGVLINLYDFFEPLSSSGYSAGSQNVFWMTDNTGSLLFSTDEGCILKPFPGEQEKEISHTLTDSFNVIRKLTDDSVMNRMPFLYKVLQIMSICSIFVIFFIFLFMRHEIIKPLRLVENALRQIEEDNLGYRIMQKASTEEFQYVYDSFNNMADDIKTLTIESYKKEIERLQLEKTSLLLQMSPHMLLNSLNMIYSLSQSKSFECIQNFCVNLSGYFRYVLRREQKFVTVEEEMQFICNYLEVQKIRYPDAFTNVYQIDEDAGLIRIPPYFIEHFVENSIKYGLSPEYVVEIIIIIRKEDDRLLISVLDTGNGIPEEKLELINRGEPVEDKRGKHIGIWNCRKRMEMYYGNEGILSISSREGEGTQVWMSIPCRTEEERSCYESADC